MFRVFNVSAKKHTTKLLWEVGTKTIILIFETLVANVFQKIDMYRINSIRTAFDESKYYC